MRSLAASPCSPIGHTGRMSWADRHEALFDRFLRFWGVMISFRNSGIKIDLTGKKELLKAGTRGPVSARIYSGKRPELSNSRYFGVTMCLI
jgi:hypothetical protein